VGSEWDRMPLKDKVKMISGLRRYNERRRRRAQLRRWKKVFPLYLQRKTVQEIAAELGVSDQMVRRDLKQIRAALLEQNRCPTCGRPLGIRGFRPNVK